MHEVFAAARGACSIRICGVVLGFCIHATFNTQNACAIINSGEGIEVQRVLNIASENLVCTGAIIGVCSGQIIACKRVSTSESSVYALTEYVGQGIEVDCRFSSAANNRIDAIRWNSFSLCCWKIIDSSLISAAFNQILAHSLVVTACLGIVV